MKLVLLLVAAVFISAPAIAQESKPAVQELPYEPAVGSNDSSKSHVEPAMYPAAKAEQEARSAVTTPAAGPAVTVSASPQGTDSNLAWGILIFTFLALCIEAFVVVKAQKPWSPQSILRVFGITFIVPLAVLLIVAGYSENQIAPVIGLLGVIAGYLLGNNDRPRASA